MDITSTPINNLEKPMTIRWCLTYMSALLFVDCYMLIRFNNNLAGVNLEWVKNNIDLNESFLIILMFTLSFAAIIPAVGYIGRVLLSSLIFKIRYEWLEKYFPAKYIHLNKYDYKDFVRIEDLKHFGIKQNNYAAYHASLNEETALDNHAFIRFICQAIVTLVIAGWFFSTDAHPSIISLFENWLHDLKWYFRIVPSMIASVLTLYIFMRAFEEQRKYYRYVFVPRHGIK